MTVKKDVVSIRLGGMNTDLSVYAVDDLLRELKPDSEIARRLRFVAQRMLEDQTGLPLEDQNFTPSAARFLAWAINET